MDGVDRDVARPRSTSRWTIATVAIVVAMVLPVALDRDSFPLSTYPMYARARTSEVGVARAVGIDAAGEVHPLSLELIGASDDPLIVAGELRAAIADGRAGQRCDEITARIDRLDAAPEIDLVAVEVVTERHDVVAWAAGDPSELARTVHARCAIGAAP